MDPVGPWSYTYNRLATVQPSAAGASSGDFHHHLATIAAATHNATIGAGIGSSSTSSSSPGSTASVQRADFSVHPATSQLLLQSGFSASNFLASPPPPSTPSNLAYETVFSPFIHAATAAAPPNPKPAHYNNIQPRHRTDAYQQQSQQQQLTILSQQQQQQQQQTQSSRSR